MTIAKAQPVGNLTIIVHFREQIQPPHYSDYNSLGWNWPLQPTKLVSLALVPAPGGLLISLLKEPRMPLH